MNLYIGLRVAYFSCCNICRVLRRGRHRTIFVSPCLLQPAQYESSLTWSKTEVPSLSSLLKRYRFELAENLLCTCWNSPLNHILISGSKQWRYTAASMKAVCFSEVAKLILQPLEFTTGGTWTACAAMLSWSTCQGVSALQWSQQLNLLGSVTWIVLNQSLRKSLSCSLDLTRQFLWNMKTVIWMEAMVGLGKHSKTLLRFGFLCSTSHDMACSRE